MALGEHTVQLVEEKSVWVFWRLAGGVWQCVRGMSHTCLCLSCPFSPAGAHLSLDYNSLRESIQESLQVLLSILAIQKSGDLRKVALEWVTTMHDLSECRLPAGLVGGT